MSAVLCSYTTRSMMSSSSGISSEETTSVPRRNLGQWLKKYFCAGQHLKEECVEKVVKEGLIHDLMTKHRKYLAVALPSLVLLFIWAVTAIRFDYFSLFSTYWQLPLVMIIGASVAGMTAESGGAVAFPFMTLAMHISSTDARDFALLIECAGMGCATFAVHFMNVQIETKSSFFAILGSIPGLIFGFVFLDDLLTGLQKKMLFVSIWSSFALALMMLNREKKRKTFSSIQNFNFSKAVIIVLTGFFGGILTAFTGSGADICIFSLITILFRVSEKVATPTTIEVMGVNALVGAYYRIVWCGDVSDLTFNYLKTSIPVALVVAPVASLIGSHFHRQVLACLVYIVELAAIVGFVATGPPISLLLVGVLIVLIGFVFFYVLGKLGARMMDSYSVHPEPPVISIINNNNNKF